MITIVCFTCLLHVAKSTNYTESQKPHEYSQEPYTFWK